VTFTPGIRQALLMLKMFRKNKDKGATAVEYGLLVALIAAVIIIIVTALGTGIRGKFQTACNAITGTTCSIS
jgi:pilus assembly protein Flp/PilA